MATKRKPKGEHKPSGPKSIYTPELGYAICADICDMTVAKALDKNGVGKSAFFEWLNLHPELAEAYARAREIRAEGYFEEIVSIPDNLTEDMMWKLADGSKVTSAVYKSMMPEEKEGAELEFGLTTERIAKARLQTDARKFYVVKLLPKLYGDAVDVTHKGDKALPVEFTLKIDNS